MSKQTELAQVADTITVNSGNIGIGTSSPSYKLHVDANTNSVFRLGTTGGGALNVLVDDYTIAAPTWRIQSGASEPISFAISTNEAMRLDSSGRLLQGNNFAVISSDVGIQTRKTSGSNSLIVGSDSTGSNEQSTISAVANYNTNTYFATLAVYRNGSNAPSGYLQLVDRNRASHFIWSDTSAVIRTSSTAGNIGGTGGTVIGTQTSDERLKTIEDSFEYGIDTVKQLVPIAYKFNSDETETRHLGFGAQTTQSIVPEAVYDSGDCIDGYDEDPDDNMVQNPRSDATKMMMDGIQLVPVLTSALQEAIAKIEALETRLTALEG